MQHRSSPLSVSLRGNTVVLHKELVLHVFIIKKRTTAHSYWLISYALMGTTLTAQKTRWHNDRLIIMHRHSRIYTKFSFSFTGYPICGLSQTTWHQVLRHLTSYEKECLYRWTSSQRFFPQTSRAPFQLRSILHFLYFHLRLNYKGIQSEG